MEATSTEIVKPASGLYGDSDSRPKGSQSPELDDNRDPYNPHVHVPLKQTILGVIFIINAFLVEWIFHEGVLVAGLSAMIGAIILSYPIVLTSIRDLNKGLMTINELVSIALLASFSSGQYKTTGIVAFFMLLGEIIESRTAAGARKSIESLIKLTPTKARKIGKDGKEEEVPVSALKVGDIIRIRPGDNMSADGVIQKGEGTINQANITGESLPVDKSVGDEVFAGTQNLTGVLEIKVTRANEESTLGKVRDLILAAEKTKLPITRIINQYMGYYTPLILTLGGLVWFFTQDLDRVISILIIGCPTAFVLATPTAMVAALSAAARLGILIKNVSDIELAAKINAFVFDKTGTLTKGELAVSRLAPVDGVKPAELLKLAASGEKYSNHPTAKALVSVAEEAGLTLFEPQDFKETAGKGVSSTVNGRRVVIGRAQWLIDQGIKLEELGSTDLKETEGFSLIHISDNGKFMGWIGLKDETRPEAQEALADLTENGVRRISMVTGDRRPVAARVAEEIGCKEVMAECLPQNKVDFVTEIKNKGYTVAVVGDGVNDAPALAAGDMGIAMGAAGSEVAIHSATIALMNNDLRRLPFLIKLSRSTRNVINQNFLAGIFFILGGLTAAAFDLLPVILAAILNICASIIVVFNSARLVRQGEELEPFLNESTEATSDDDEVAASGPTERTELKTA
ncbi:MAG TPA: cadmium-translocating P-type ATPase [Verrucomicrobiales bacterium]|nr:cadmium-translocating P-type ATPase [Verrucomicrobiales bacterium]HIL69517.1 cadmium-translocating P-type ATPase [Verrucomicrobiota bacterium]